MPRRSNKTAPAPAARKLSGAQREQRGAKESEPKRPFGRWAWDWIKSLAAGLALFLVVRAFILQTWVITSGSMENTLLTGDLLVLNKVAYGAQIPGTDARLPGYTSPHAGDVVVFYAQHEPLDVIKRIMGMPGDTLEMRRKILYRNGLSQNEPYVRYSDPESKTDEANPLFAWQKRYLLGSAEQRANYRPTRDNWGPFVVPPDSLFMMGDNRDDSLDSRFWGFLAAQRVKGKAEVVYYSYERDQVTPLAWLRRIRWSRIGNRIR